MDTWRDGLLKYGDEIEIYITKYALTEGITKEKAVWLHINDRPHAKCASGCLYAIRKLGKTWHLTWESALERATKNRARAIKLLKTEFQKNQAERNGIISNLRLQFNRIRNSELRSLNESVSEMEKLEFKKPDIDPDDQIKEIKALITRSDIDTFTLSDVIKYLRWEKWRMISIEEKAFIFEMPYIFDSGKTDTFKMPTSKENEDYYDRIKDLIVIISEVKGVDYHAIIKEIEIAGLVG